MASSIATLFGFVADERAATSIQYALIATIVSVGILVSIQLFATSLSNLWNYSSTTIDGAIGR